MKKVLAFALAFVMLFSFAACAQPNQTPSNYPANISEWNGQNFVDYFKEKGAFVEGNGRESWLQDDHSMYYPGTPIYECAGYWDEAGEVFIMIFILKDDLADSTPEAYNAMIQEIKETKQIDMETQAVPIDHLIGNVAFCFSWTFDEETLAAVESAYNDLVKDLGVTPEF